MPGGPELRLLELWHGAAATGAQLLWRIGASFSLPVDEMLRDGTYLSRRGAAQARKDGAADITVRVIEYRLETTRNVTETFTLITTLLDAERRLPPAGGAVPGQVGDRDRAGSLKTQLKAPDRAAVQDAQGYPGVWALLCAYHAVRELISAAAALAGKTLCGSASSTR